MSTRLFGVLFASLFVIGVAPVLFLQSFGSAGAGVTAGFLLIVGDFYHVAVLSAIGLSGAWLGGEVVLLLPLSTILMLVTGSLTEINGDAYHALHAFIAGAIILYASCVSLLRKKAMLAYIAPASVWAFMCGGSFMHSVPVITTPLFFMMGTVVGSTLILAIGVTLGITLSDKVQEWGKHFKVSGAFATFLSLF